MADFNSIRFEPNRPLLRELSAERLNAILQEIKRSRPLPGRGISVRQEGYGVRIDAQAQTSQSAISSAPPHPFKLSTVVDPETEETQIRVRYGTIDGVAPTGMSLGDDPPYLLTPDAESGVIYAVVTWDPDVGGPLLSRDLGQDEELPVDLDDTAHFEIGSWTTDENDNIILAQAVTNIIEVVICRNWFAVEGPYWNVTFLT
jgi:hypothetical protein